MSKPTKECSICGYNCNCSGGVCFECRNDGPTLNQRLCRFCKEDAERENDRWHDEWESMAFGDS